MNDKAVKTLIVDERESGSRLDRWVKRQFDGVTQGQVEKLLRTGQIRVDGARAKSSTRIEAGQEIRIPPNIGAVDEKRLPPRGKDKQNEEDRELFESLIIFENDDLIALNKPAGLAVQGGTNTPQHVDRLLNVRATEKYRPKLVHRLDRDTSGLLIVAKHPKSAADLGALFRERTMKKVYWAVTVGVPHPQMGQIRSWMVKGTGDALNRERMVPAVHGTPGAVHAITDYIVVSSAGTRAAWVALGPQTGRMHQLRFHMEEMGTSILGDRKYPTRRQVPDSVADGLHLHARALQIPTGGRKGLLLEAPLPKHMKETFHVLGFNEKDAGKNPMEIFE